MIFTFLVNFAFLTLGICCGCIISHFLPNLKIGANQNDSYTPFRLPAPKKPDNTGRT